MKNLIFLLCIVLSFASCNNNKSKEMVLSHSVELPDDVWAPPGHNPSELGDMFKSGKWIEMSYYINGTKRSILAQKCGDVVNYSEVTIQTIDSYPEGIIEGKRTFTYLVE